MRLSNDASADGRFVGMLSKRLPGELRLTATTSLVPVYGIGVFSSSQGAASLLA